MQIDGWNPKDIGYDTGYNHTYGVGTDADAKSTGVAEGSKGECQTCKNRKYQDGSNENVSFKSASHISPEAAAGGLLAYVKDGDQIAIDIPNHKIELLVDEEEIARRMAETGMRYRRELGDFGADFLDSIKGIRELVLYNAGEARAAEVDRRSDAMLGRTKALRRETALSAAATEAAVSLSVLAVLAVGIFLVHSGSLSVGRMVLGVTAVFGSFGPVIAVSALPANLNQTFASGERILRLLEDISLLIRRQQLRADRCIKDALQAFAAG